MVVFFFSSRRRHTRCGRDWSSDVCSSDLAANGLSRGWREPGGALDRDSRMRATSAFGASRPGQTLFAGVAGEPHQRRRLSRPGAMSQGGAGPRTISCSVWPRLLQKGIGNSDAKLTGRRVAIVTLTGHTDVGRDFSLMAAQKDLARSGLRAVPDQPLQKFADGGRRDKRGETDNRRLHRAQSGGVTLVLPARSFFRAECFGRGARYVDTPAA